MDSNLRRSIILDNYNNPNNRQRHDNDDYIKTTSLSVRTEGGSINLIRVDRKALSRCEIVRMAANRFLNDGFTKTTVASMGKALHMSTGNMTFYFATKEHMLAELVNMLVKYQWGKMETEAGDGNSVMAVCLELLQRISSFPPIPVLSVWRSSARTT